MLNVLFARFKQGHRTIDFPNTEPVLPDRFRGAPIINAAKCPSDCHACVEACPTDAIRIDSEQTKPSLNIDLGRCLFCTDCQEHCPKDGITYSQDYHTAARKREDLIVSNAIRERARLVDEKIKHWFGRSLKLRQVSAGGCNACEADVNVLNTVVYDLGRFGIQFVASPRHADGLLITGPVTENMRWALQKTYDAVPSPKIVIAVGACAISGGPYIDHPEVHNGADGVLPVDLYIPGCPPHPLTILDGLLRLLGKCGIEK